ncbi:SGNH/GDSL hydrolase family protein [Oceanibium sediminis]|uniref:SGNH/GDSL hydrolase family protein n=1 Tax=Oceanibium sediminis TaxID=2026339 RepID=UPI000DD4E4D6|nr:SGNH/GDSL hydrolase family protein [Oceanibium sediminis]
MNDRKNVLCFGDSLTWGWVPVAEGAPTTRFAPDVRWTGVMAAELGDGYHVIEEGLSARTTNLDDPGDPRLNGAAHLPTILASHMPLDLVVIMLGTNDTKSYFKRTPYEIANGMAALAGIVGTSAYGVGTPYPAPQLMIVAPPPLGKLGHPHFEGMFEGGPEKTRELAGRYEALADFVKCHFLDAGKHISTDGVDGIHFTAQNNRDLGLAMSAKVRDILG